MEEVLQHRHPFDGYDLLHLRHIRIYMAWLFIETASQASKEFSFEHR